jgi:diacylglycerol kinase (ATP)
MSGIKIIVNPRAGRGAVERGWPAARAVLEEGGLTYDMIVTERAGHAGEIARAAALEGAEMVVAVGGDGTVHEVVNGLMGADGAINPACRLGVVAAGSGCDFVKTFGLPADPALAATHLLGDGEWGRLDIGRIRFIDRDGKAASRWFANIAEAGLGADVVDAAGRMPKWLGGRVYKLAAFTQIAKHKPWEATVRLHGRKARGSRIDAPLEEISYEGPLSMVVVANCQFFGGGMKVAPRAIPSDGLLDVQIAHGPKSEAAKAMTKIGKGTHIPSKFVLEYLAEEMTITSETPILIEADGEVIGSTPATFDLVADAIPLKI